MTRLNPTRIPPNHVNLTLIEQKKIHQINIICDDMSLETPIIIVGDSTLVLIDFFTYVIVSFIQANNSKIIVIMWIIITLLDLGFKNVILSEILVDCIYIYTSTPVIMNRMLMQTLKIYFQTLKKLDYHYLQQQQCKATTNKFIKATKLFFNSVKQQQSSSSTV